MLPDFLFIGAAKCGSTWFFDVLREHPEIYVPRAKDIYYFDQHYDRPLDWYERFFREVGPGHRAVGEVSHDYLFSREAADRILADLGRIRLLACLRDPIDRAVSAYSFMCRNGTAADTFRATVEANPRLIERGRYTEYVRYYRERFGDHLKIVLFDDLKRDPAAVARDCYRFLGVDEHYSGDAAARRSLPASRARVRWLARLTKKVAWQLRDWGLADVIGRVKSSPLTSVLYRPLKAGERFKLDDEDRAWLQNYFAADVEALRELLGEPLSGWLEPAVEKA
jgi:hypothetical protein